MKVLLLMFAHLLTTVAKLLGAGGAKAGRVESWRGSSLGSALSVSGVSPFVPE